MVKAMYVWVRGDEYVCEDYHSGGYVCFLDHLIQAKIFRTTDEALKFKAFWLNTEHARASTWTLHEVTIRPSM